MTVTVVVGPPAAGKSTFVRERAKPDDLVVDYDALAVALGASSSHESSGAVRKAALVAREAAIGAALATDGDAWIIHTSPRPSSLEVYQAAGVTFELLDPGIDVVLKQAKSRPAGTEKAIRDWYAAPPKLPTPEVGSTKKPRRQHMSTDTSKSDEKEPLEGDDDEELDLSRAKAKIAKANSEAAGLRKRLADLEAAEKKREDEKKDDLTKAQEAAADLQKKLDEATTESTRLRVALAKGLTEKQALRLQGSSREELEADADEFLSDLKPSDDSKKTPPVKTPKESLRGGSDPTNHEENEPTADEAAEAILKNL